MQSQLQCGSSRAHVTLLTLVFIGIASLLSNLQNTTSRLAVFPTITLSSLYKFTTTSRPLGTITTPSPLLYQIRITIFKPIQISRNIKREMAGGKGKSTGGKAGPKEVTPHKQKSHSAKAGLQVSITYLLLLVTCLSQPSARPSRYESGEGRTVALSLSDVMSHIPPLRLSLYTRLSR